MKILNVVIAKTWGGGEQYVYDTAKALGNKGEKIYVAVDRSNYAMQERFSEVAEVVTADLYCIAGLQSWLQLNGFIKEERIDIICCHSGHAMLLCLLLKLSAGAKLVCLKHNAIKVKTDWFHKWQRKHTDAIVCVSKLVYGLQTEGLSPQEKSKFYLVYNGIDPDRFRHVMRKERAGRQFIIGYAGRIARDKGLDTLIEAYGNLREKDDFRIVVAGSDEKNYKREIEIKIKNEGIEEKVEFLGQITDMSEFYSRIDALVLPSRAREAFGLVLCEAMYCGVPVITTDSGAQKEIICDSRYGVIVKKGDAGAIAQGLENLQQNDDYYVAVVKAAKERVQKYFTVSRCATELNAVFYNCKKV